MNGYDCQSCGACCIANWDTESYVGLFEDDVRTLTRALPVVELDRITMDRGDPWKASLKTKENEQGHITCIALDGCVGEHVSCSIYELRPGPCKSFRPGSEECKLAREEAGLPTGPS